jgi:hypothetical protein
MPPSLVPAGELGPKQSTFAAARRVAHSMRTMRHVPVSSEVAAVVHALNRVCQAFQISLFSHGSWLSRELWRSF